MCSVSMVGDVYRQKWLEDGVFTPTFVPTPPVSRVEFDVLKKEVEDLKRLLKAAKEYDERNNEPHCETDEKMDLLRKVAKLVGVELDDVLKPKADE